MTFTPATISPRRLAVMTDALHRLAGHWPKSFPWLHGTSEHTAAMRADYARATLGANIDVIPEAAERWIETEKFAPKVAEFGKLCRDLSPAPASIADPLQIPAFGDRGRRVDRLYAIGVARLRERKVSAFARPMAQVWALLLEANAEPAVQEQIREGDVDDAVFLATVDAWCAGKRPKGHRMNNLGMAPPPKSEPGAAA